MKFFLKIYIFKQVLLKTPIKRDEMLQGLEIVYRDVEFLQENVWIVLTALQFSPIYFSLE